MKTVTNVARMLVRITGALQIILGLIVWFGVADILVPIHILSGIILVISLLALAIVAARVGVNRGLVAFAIVWALAVAVFSLAQEQLLPDQGHWIIQVVHLLVGLSLIGLGERLARQIMDAQKPVVAG